MLISLQNKQPNKQINASPGFMKGKIQLKLQISVIFFLYSVISVAVLGVFSELIITVFREQQIGQLGTDLMSLSLLLC